MVVVWSLRRTFGFLLARISSRTGLELTELTSRTYHSPKAKTTLSVWTSRICPTTISAVDLLVARLLTLCAIVSLNQVTYSQGI
jgi:hypothetical protein